MSFCMKCGRQLTQGKCPNCDSIDISEKSKKQQIASNKKDTKPKSKKERIPIGKKKLAVIISVCAAVVIAIAVGAVFLGISQNKNSDYEDAIALLDDGKSEKAAQIFEDLGSFKDSETFLQECKVLTDYNEAVETMQDENYAEAIELLAALGDYEDSQELLQLSQNNLDYEGAVALFDSGDFEQAKTMFSVLTDFKDSALLAQDCQVRLDYAMAVGLFDAGDYLTAKIMFGKTPGYEDSANLVLVCEFRIAYDNATKRIDNEDFEGAWSLLNSLKKDIADSGIDFNLVLDQSEFDAARDNCSKHISYNRGKSFFDQGLFYSAYLSFSNADGLLDADELALSCAQPIETGEIYVNPEYTENRVSVTFYAPVESGNSVCVRIYSGNDLASMLLIKAGEKLRIKLPDGMFSFNIGKGIDWYGEEEFFGLEGYYGTLIVDESNTTLLRKLKLLIPYYNYSFRFETEEGNLPSEEIKQSEF